MKHLLIFFLFLFFSAPVAHSTDSTLVLAEILAGKGVITAEQRDQVERAGPEGAARILAGMLLDKGLLTPAETARVDDGVIRAAGSNAARSTAPGIVNASLVQTPQAASQLTAQPAPAPAVTTQSKLPLSLYGTILLNSFYDTGAVNIEDVPVLSAKRGTDPFENFGMTARQTRLGLRYQGAAVAGGKLSGQVEIDLFGGKAALPNGINFDIVRLRLAYGRVDWKNFSLVAGQDWEIFAPLNPTSLAGFSVPDFSASGNPWIRTPQIRAELRHTLSEKASMQWQIAATDPNVGDNATVFQTIRTPGIGEHGRMPGIDSRLAFTSRIQGGDATVALSSHYNRGKNLGTIGNVTVDRSVDSWGVAADYMLPLTKRFSLTGELYEGRALGIFSASLGQAVLPVGTRGEHGVETRGGWTQAQFNIAARWQANLGYGLEAPDASELRTGDRSKNQTYMTNLMFKISPNRPSPGSGDDFLPATEINRRRTTSAIRQTWPSAIPSNLVSSRRVSRAEAPGTICNCLAPF